MELGWAWWWTCVAMLVFWGFVAWVAVTLVRRRDEEARERRDARDILEERYAQDEIDDDESRRRSGLVRR
jgi:uncharacterized membrane protein